MCNLISNKGASIAAEEAEEEAGYLSRSTSTSEFTPYKKRSTKKHYKN